MAAGEPASEPTDAQHTHKLEHEWPCAPSTRNLRRHIFGRAQRAAVAKRRARAAATVAAASWRTRRFGTRKQYERLDE